MAQNRFEAIDGLRGAAALIVLVHHIELTKRTTTWFLHGYLAVDLFFLLSGFVIGHAYEKRLQSGMGLPFLLRERLIRLYPLAALGAVAGFLGALWIRHLDNASAGLALQLLFIPALWQVGDLFLVNGVQWSLLLELLANVAHGISFPRLTTRRLFAVVCASAVLLVATAHHFGSLGVGWGAQNAWGGLVRVLFSYAAGLVIYRLYRRDLLPQFRLPWPLLALGPVAAVLVAGQLGWKGDVLAVLSFPLFLIAGIFTPLPRRVAKVAVFAGMVSYPVYALQGPLKLFLRGWIEAIPGPLELFGWLFYVLSLVLIAWLAVRYFDEPVRRWLRQPRQAPQAL